MSERSTFSPFWHRVRVMKPRLRPHVQITRQFYRAQRWHVVHDPSSNQFYRLNPVANEFVGLLDGQRTVEEVWQLGLTRHADNALTQNEAINLLSQLFSSNLLTADIQPETEQMLRRGRERTTKKWKQQAIGLMYFKVRLFNPDAILTWLSPIVRPMLSVWGLLIWAVLVISAAATVLPDWERLRSGFDGAVAPSNWPLMVCVFVALKLIHESGHGLICKRFGGQVPEFGAMMLVLVPAPYVDASAAWSFRDKWQRLLVGAGGMLFELFVAAICAFIWKRAPDGSLASQLSFNAMLTASVSTVVFNANPLMRFDGYYMLSDLLEVPNLMQRSQAYLKYLCQIHLYRIKNATPPTTNATEALILLVYGLLAMIYRVVLFVSITLYIMGKMFAIGLFLAIWTTAMWFILPVGGFIHWLATSPMLADKRARAIITTLILFAASLLVIGAVPMPDHRRASGVVESRLSSGLFFGTDGFVKTAHVRTGDRVKTGDPVVTLESKELEAQLATARAQLAEAIAQETNAVASNAVSAQVATQYVASMREQVDYLEGKIAKLVVRAPHAGVVVAADPADLLGMYAHEGQPICEIVEVDDLRVAAVLPQAEGDWISTLPAESYQVEMRGVSRIDEIAGGKPIRMPSGARKELPHSALTYAGGGTIETDAQERSGLISKNPIFKAYFVPEAGEDGAVLDVRPGERVALRFTLPSRPLLAQWYDRLEKTLQGRTKL